MRNVIIGAALATAGLGAAAWAVQRMCALGGTRALATLSVPEGRTIEIRAAAGPEMSPALYYVVPGSLTLAVIGFARVAPGQLAFRTFQDAGGHLVGITERSDPHVVLILHDFKTGASWPHVYCSETWRQARIRGKRMLARLQAAHPAKEFVLSEEAGPDRGVRIR